MKIARTQYNPALAPLNASAAEQTRSQAEEGNNIVNIRPTDLVLGEAQTKMATMPEVDMAHVEAMKEAISARKIDINVDDLADAMQNYYQR